MQFKEPEWKEIDGVKYFHFNSEYEMWRYRWSNILTAIFLIILLGLGIFMGIYVKAIVKQPFIYGIDKINEDQNANFMCSCVDGIKSFDFNSSGFYQSKSKISLSEEE